MKEVPAYSTELINKTKKVQYLFESKGEKNIIKAIEYTAIRKIQGRTIYNLGFGDYDEETGEISDDTNSNNGDMYKVFSTVLDTIPKFFKENPDAAIYVQGSDSADEFVEQCKETCRRNCAESKCRNVDRRIKTYRYYVDKNFSDLSQEYLFFGSSESDLVQYVPKTEYNSILVFRKK